MPDRRRRLSGSRQIHRQQHVQFRVIDRLGQVKVEASLTRQSAIGFLAPSGDGDDARPGLGGSSPQFARHVEARHARHAQVEQDDFRLELEREPEPFLPIMGLAHLVAGSLQQKFLVEVPASPSRFVVQRLHST